MTAVPFLLATRSLGKRAELLPLFADAGVDVIDLDAAGIHEVPEEESIERFGTFEENALAKARYFHDRSGGMPTLVDDSGLEVVALGGAPGVRTKRWSGRADLVGRALDAANNERLLREMEGIADRRARYVCVAVCLTTGEEIVCRGESGGAILTAPRGKGGFGYDPLVCSTDLGRAFAELDRAEKECVSHRGRAFRALLARLARGRVAS